MVVSLSCWALEKLLRFIIRQLIITEPNTEDTLMGQIQPRLP